MKKSILTAMLGLGLAPFSSADTIYVTGSTAFRTSFVDAVVTKMLENGGTVTALHSGANAAAFNSATRQVITGNINTVPTTIRTFWSGSVEGVQAVVQPTVRIESYLSGTGTSLTRGGLYPAFTYAGGTGSATTVSPHAADLAMSDCFQNSTVYTTPVVSDTNVCVIPFKFVASKNSDTAGASGTGFDNITPLQAQLLWGAGRVSLSLFTFNAADNRVGTTTRGKEVFAMGRANTSGTRLVAFAEMGRGALSNATQYSFNGTSSGGSPNAGGWTAFPTGIAGDSSTNMRDQLALPASGSTGYGIGYLGLTDAAVAITNGAKELKWNGVSYSAANVQSGKYTFWAYEHLLANPSASVAALDFAAAIATQISAQPGAAGLSADPLIMNVQRGAEGGLIDLND